MWQESRYTYVMAESKPCSVEFYGLSKEEKVRYVSKLYLVDGVYPYTLTTADLVENIECLPPLR